MGLLKVEVPGADSALFNVGALSADLRNLIRKLDQSGLDVPTLVGEANDAAHAAIAEVREAAKRVQTMASQATGALQAHSQAMNRVGLLADIAIAVLLGLVAGAGIKGAFRVLSNWPSL